jgi:Ala-tRNA(Pro) deacylase
MEREFRQLKNFLDEHKINYTVSEHEPVYTSEQAAKVRGVPIKTGVKALVFKVLAEEPYYIHVDIPADRKASFEKLEKLIGYKIKLARPEEVLGVCGCEIGSVHPFGNLFKLDVYMDERILENETVNFNAGLHTISIKMSPNDLKLLVKPILGDFTE